MLAAMGASEGLGAQLRALTENTASYMMYDDTHVVRINKPNVPAAGAKVSDLLDVSLPQDEEGYLEPVIFNEVARVMTQDQQPGVVDCIARLVGSNVVYLNEARERLDLRRR